MQDQPLSPIGASDAFHGWTVASLSLIALGALVVLIGIIYGTRLARARRRAREAASERIDTHAKSATSSARVEQEVATSSELPATMDARSSTTDPAPLPPLDPAAKSKNLPKARPTPKVDSKSIETKESAPTLPLSPPPIAARSSGLPITTIKGLGPKVAARLDELGITQVDQIAALEPAEADALDAQLGNFSGRMARDRWIDQAKLLIAGDTAAYEAEFGKLG